MNYRHNELRQRLAEAYVLGTLRGAARRRFDRLLVDDAVLRAEVDKLSSRLDTLAEALPPTQPSMFLWPSIERRLWPQTQHDDDPPEWVWINFKFWRAWAVLATLATVGIALWTLLAPPPPVYVVVITKDASAEPSWVLQTSDRATQLKVKNVASQASLLPQQRDFQLWVKVKNQPKVKPVGLIPANGEVVLQLPPALIGGSFDQVELVGVSVEPEGGSPTGQPTTTPLSHGTTLRF